MTTRQTPELVPATEKQVAYLASLAIKTSDDPMSRLALMLADLNIIDLDDEERELFLSKEQASQIIDQLKKKEQR